MSGDMALPCIPTMSVTKTLLVKMSYCRLSGGLSRLWRMNMLTLKSGAVKITPAHDFNDFEVGSAAAGRD